MITTKTQKRGFSYTTKILHIVSNHLVIIKQAVFDSNYQQFYIFDLPIVPKNQNSTSYEKHT
ncbi:MAG: hypothetical protein RL662_406 [Bacteroidota bacterium]|jgi:hypothetical protein